MNLQKDDNFGILKHFSLDYEKLKRFLASEDEGAEAIIVTILNALRKRLVNSEIVGRKQTIYSFIYTDVFDMKLIAREEEKPIF